MKEFLRLNLSDSNHTFKNEKHVWSIPLNLENRRVGLSSLALKLRNLKPHKDFIYLSITSNLVERNMHNQKALLALIPLNSNDELTFTHTTNNIGKILALM